MPRSCPRTRAGTTVRQTATYVHAGIREVATALAALTGEPHPLGPARGRPARPAGLTRSVMLLASAAW
jgi:hypothetical protein